MPSINKVVGTELRPKGQVIMQVISLSSPIPVYGSMVFHLHVELYKRGKACADLQMHAYS